LSYACEFYVRFSLSLKKIWTYFIPWTCFRVRFVIIVNV